MTRVSVSHLRQHLPAYLKRVQAGEAIQITSRGRVIARLEAEHDPAQAATALHLGASLITADAKLRALPELDTIW